MSLSLALVQPAAPAPMPPRRPPVEPVEPEPAPATEPGLSIAAMVLGLALAVADDLIADLHTSTAAPGPASVPRGPLES
jgi:hypothetical protein